ncbi:MAG TPA: GntR family transcriptional regulator [Syntrophorhabdaceae bacterium]|nr:GntR family transcriptional regulator [Syntrophorhabdaceae bacterium]
MVRNARKPSTNGDSLSIRPLQSKRAYREIADQIRELIFSRAVKPGDKLPSENELASRFGAGRLSVREALRMLEQAGLVRIKQGNTGGCFVKELDSSIAAQSMLDLIWQGDVNIADITEARIDVEKGILIRAFARITKQEIRAIDKWIGELEVLVSQGKQKRYPVIPTITKFHMMLADATHNTVFPVLLSVLVDVTGRTFNVHELSRSRLKTHIEFYRAVHRALMDKDLAAALKALNEHMIEVRQMMIRSAEKKA